MEHQSGKLGKPPDEGVTREGKALQEGSEKTVGIRTEESRNILQNENGRTETGHSVGSKEIQRGAVTTLKTT